jgi:hypothetical protein
MWGQAQLVPHFPDRECHNRGWVLVSLYPWDFHSTQLAASSLWVLIQSWPTGIDQFLLRDIAVKLLIFVPVGGFGFLALRQDFRTSVAESVTLLFALGLSSSIEMIQLFDDGRECTASTSYSMSVAQPLE